MTTEQNKALIKKLFNEGLNERKLNLADEIISSKFVIHGIPNAKNGPDGFREIIQQFLDAFPDMMVTVENVIGEGDTVATRGSWTGTNKGSFMGMPSTGKKVKVEYADFWKIENGKCTENWVSMDIAGMMQQMGMAPATA